MKKILSSKKFIIWFTTAVALLGVFVAAISTTAWFQLDSQNPELSLVSGSSDININSVTGYKKDQGINASGDYYTKSEITPYDLTTNTALANSKVSTNNTASDTNYDIPEDGVGYYLVVPSSTGSYKYHDASVHKFTEYNEGSLGYIDSVALYHAKPFRIRHYSMSGSVTTSEQLKITDTNQLTNAPAGTTVPSGDVQIGSSNSTDANYKVWIDFSNLSTIKLGFEYDSAIQAQGQNNPSSLNEGDGFKYNNVKKTINVDGDKYPNRVVIVLDAWAGAYNAYITLGSTTVSGSSTSGTPYSSYGGFYANFDNPSDTTKLKIDFKKYEDNAEWTCFPWNGTWDGDDKNLVNLGGVTITKGNVYKYHCGDWKYNHDANHYKVFESGNSFEYVDSLVQTVQISTDGGTDYTSMEHNSGNEWKYTLTTSTDSQSLKFKLNDTVQGSLVRKTTGESDFNKNNCTVSGNTATITYGTTASITVYYDISSKEVWVDQVFKLKVGSNYFLLLKQSDKQYKASYYGTKGNEVAICNSGNSNTVSFNLDGGDYNNVKLESSVKKLQKTVLNSAPMNAFYNNQGNSDTRPDVPTSSSTLWMEGNKNYRVGYRYGDSGNFTYTDMSYDESTGKYKASGLALTYKATNAKLNFQINQANINGTNAVAISKDTGTGNTTDQDYYVYNNVSGVSGSIASVTYGGTVDVYYDTSNGKIIVTPVYSVKITASGTLKQATGSGDLRTATRTASNLTASEGDLVYVYVNNLTAYSYTAAPAENNVDNNITSGGAIKSLGRTASASVDVKVYVRTTSSGSRTIYVTGFVDFVYYLTVTHANSTTNGYSMTEVNSQMKAASVPVVKGDKLTFEKNFTSVSATAENAARNNVENNNGITIICDGTVDVYLKNYTTTPVVWVTGFKTTFYFYNSDPSVSSSQRYYVIFTGGDKGAVQMSQDNDDSRLHYYQYEASDGTHMSISTNSNGSGTCSSSVNIANLSFETRPYATYTTTGTGTGKSLDWYTNGPQTGSDNYYVYGGYSKAYAWSSASEDGNNPTKAYMKFKGLHFPGFDMTPVISGSLYVVSGINPTIYDKLIFNNGSNQTSNLDTANNSGGVYFQGNNWGTLKNNTVYGRALIHRIHNNVEQPTVEMSIGDSGITSSNYFVYEHGIQASHGDYLWVEVTNIVNGNATGNKKICTERTENNIKYYDPGQNGIYYNYDDKREFVDCTGSNPSRPYLTIIQTQDEGDHKGIQVNIGNGNSARFNFYITKLGKLAIVMVPDLGNGFYMMDNSKTSKQEGFIGAIKMETINATNAVFNNYYASGNETFYISSYLDAVETLHYVDAAHSTGITVIQREIDGVNQNVAFSLTTQGYYDIQVSNGKVVVTAPNQDNDCQLNYLDVTGINDELTASANQTYIKGQNTSFVIKVDFTCKNSNDFQLASSLVVNNISNSHLGVSYYVTTTNVANPYLFMRDEEATNTDSTTTRYVLSNSSSVSNINTGFGTNKNDTTTHYYAYILIDYKYSNTLKANLPTTSDLVISFKIATSRKAS